MSFFDVILLLIWAGFVFYGLFFGLIRVIGSITGIIVGTIISYYFYLDFFNLIQNWFFGLDNIGKIISSVLLFGIVNKLVSLCFILLDKTYNILSILPFLKSINKIGGAILGFFQGGLILGLFFYIISKYSFISVVLGKFIVDSKLYPILIKFINFVLPMLSSVVNNL